MESNPTESIIFGTAELGREVIDPQRQPQGTGLVLAAIAPADGAFYIYADVGALTNDSESFCRRILDETGVALTPGLDFDPDRGNRYVRFSYAETGETIAAAAAALRDRSA